MRALARQRHAGDRGVLQLPHLQPQLRAERRRLHDLALAGKGPVHQRGHAAEGELHRAGVVGDGRARRRRRLPGLAAHAHDAAPRLRRAVEHRLAGLFPQGAETVHVPHDQPRVSLRQTREPERHAFQGGLPDVGEKHVGALEQLRHDGLPEFGVQVERDRALRLVHREELRAERVLRQRLVVDAPVIAARVPHRGLHLDDVGAHVREVEAGGRGLYGHAEFDDAQSFEWSRHVPSPPGPVWSARVYDSAGRRPMDGRRLRTPPPASRSRPVPRHRPAGSWPARHTPVTPAHPYRRSSASTGYSRTARRSVAAS